MDHMYVILKVTPVKPKRGRKPTKTRKESEELEIEATKKMLIRKMQSEKGLIFLFSYYKSDQAK